MAKIIIPTPLRKFTDNNAALDVNGATVGESINELVTAFPGLKQHLQDQSEKIRSYVNVFVGDENMRSLENENTPVAEDTVISIVPAMPVERFDLLFMIDNSILVIEDWRLNIENYEGKFTRQILSTKFQVSSIQYQLNNTK